MPIDLNAPAGVSLFFGLLITSGILLYRQIRRPGNAASPGKPDVLLGNDHGLRELFDISPTGLLVTRLSDGVVLYINPKLADLMGQPAESFVGRPAPDFYAHTADREQLVALLAKNGSVQDYELTIRRPDGELIWASFSANIHRFGDEDAIFASVIDISLRKDSESILIDATRTFRDLLQDAPTAIVISDLANGEIVFGNHHAAGVLGLSQDELIGRSTRSFYASTEEHDGLLATLRAGERIQDVETEFRDASGNMLWIRQSARLTDFEGRPAVISIWNDITDSRLGDQKIRDSERNHRLALEAAPFPLIIASATDHSLLLLNRRALPALRITSDTPLDHLIADDFLDASVRAEISEMLAGGEEITDREALIRPRSGPRYWALASSRRIDFEGDPAFILSFTDISEHKRIERDIADSRTTLRSMINASPIWMAMFDRSGYYQLVNQPFENLFGKVASSIEGRHYSEIMGQEMTALHAPLINRCIEGEVVDFEAPLETGHGGSSALPTHVHGKYSPVIAKDGMVSGGVLAMIDITERHKAEEKLKAQFDEINRLHQRLQEQVVRDPLTGLFNRRYLDETLDRELARARREGYPIGVIMLDIDHFKRLNDTYGHQAGDEVLKALSKLFTEGMREGDIPCRYGGEEFTLVLPNASASIARERAEEWRLRFSELVTRFGRFDLKSTISLGIAAYPEHGKTRDELIHSADAALYASKHAGRNQSTIFTPDIDAAQDK